ncbi:MAG TPA: outer membrane protein transport protein [Thermoanaerobaculia bacterium]|jgi:long-chain fatty acid transport protein
MPKTILAAALLLIALPLQASDQNAKAAGMGGAFAAQANDASAIYYNPGGLALLEKPKGIAAGLNVTSLNQGLYQGLPPGIGAGTVAEQQKNRELIPHAFLSMPLGDRIVAGLGTFYPYRRTTEWAEPEQFAGRFLATRSSLEALDFAPTIAVRAGSTLGIGAGIIYRSSKVSATRLLGAELDGVTRNIASVAMSTDLEPAFGFSAGVLHRPSPHFAWGLTYRSAISTDYVGVGTLTQIATGDTQFDQLVAAAFPFDRPLPLSSGFNFPAEATAAVAWSPSKPVLVEVDYTRTGWSDVREVNFAFSANPNLDTRYRLDFKDTSSLRAGLRFQFPTGPQVRFGYAFEQSPQPDQTVGPFLADSDRNILTAGVGLDWLHVAFAWTTYDRRIITTNVDGVNGNYRANEWSVLITAVK